MREKTVISHILRNSKVITFARGWSTLGPLKKDDEDHHYSNYGSGAGARHGIRQQRQRGPIQEVRLQRKTGAQLIKTNSHLVGTNQPLGRGGVQHLAQRNQERG